jgi:hypothetical protein
VKFFFQEISTLQYIGSFFVDTIDEISPHDFPLEIFEETTIGVKQFTPLLMIESVLIIAPSNDTPIPFTYFEMKNVSLSIAKHQFSHDLKVCSLLSEVKDIHSFLAQKDSLEAIIHDYIKLDIPIPVFIFPNTTSFLEIKTFIGKTVGFDYNTAKNSIDFYYKNGTSSGAPCPYPCKATYSVLSFAFSSSIEIKKIYCELIHDVSEENLSQTAAYWIYHIAFEKE